jgi:hypothetical protein
LDATPQAAPSVALRCLDPRAHEPVVLFGRHAPLDVDIAVIQNPDPTGIVSIDDIE